MSLSLPGPIPLVYLQIKVYFPFPGLQVLDKQSKASGATSRLGQVPEDTCTPESPAWLRKRGGTSPKMGFPFPSAPGFVPKPKARQTRNRSLGCCRAGASGAKGSSPTPNTFTSTIIFWIRVWRQCLGSGLQLCLTLECRRKGPCGPANLAAIKDIHYAITNRLRRVRHWRCPTACFEGQGHLLSWTLATPQARSKPGQLNSRVKAKEASRTQEHPFPSPAAPSPHGKHIWDLQYKRPKLQLTAGRKQERVRHHHPEPGEALGDAWSHTLLAGLGPRSQHAHGSSSAARTAAGTHGQLGVQTLLRPGDLSHLEAVMPPKGCPRTHLGSTQAAGLALSASPGLWHRASSWIAPDTSFARTRSKHKSPEPTTSFNSLPEKQGPAQLKHYRVSAPEKPPNHCHGC